MAQTTLSETDVAHKVEELLGQLTLEEKVSLLSGRDWWRTQNIDRLGIPSLTMTDGPHGVRAENEIEERIQGPATAYPTGSAMAATWNPELIERVGVGLGEEARHLGCDILLGPCVNIVRVPLAGRNFEAFSEDPFLAGRMGAAWVRGVQSQNIGASLKHFACNNQEFNRLRGSSVVDERTLREIYLPAFEHVVKEAQPWTVMNAYNRLNGVYASQNRYLLTEILREEWGFQGLVVSDWFANHSITESVAAGMDLEMPGPVKYFGRLLVEAVKNWQIEEAVVDNAVRRVLALLVRSGRMEPGTWYPSGSGDTPEHRALALDAAREAITLLKNGFNLLPLDRTKLKRLAVIGPNAGVARYCGGGSSRLAAHHPVSPLEGIQAAAGAGVKVTFEPGCGYDTDEEDSAAILRAIDLAKASDAVVVVVGMPKFYESEGQDRPHMDLPGRQNELVRAVAGANAKTVVVVNVGAPVALPWVQQVPALLLAYYPGQEGGTALGEILFGAVNPSGKLPVTFPRRLEDNPAYLNYPGDRRVVYGEGLFVGYRYYDQKDVDPLFPFGFGLSYTRFEYSHLLMPLLATIGDTLTVSVRVQNCGSRAGKETLQLYVRDVESSLVRPLKELKGFRKVALEPGESQTVEFTLDLRSFAFYHPQRKQWVVEPGEFEILLGSSSRDLRLWGTLELKN